MHQHSIPLGRLGLGLYPFMNESAEQNHNHNRTKITNLAVLLTRTLQECEDVVAMLLPTSERIMHQRERQQTGSKL